MINQKEKIEKAGTFFRFEDLRIYNKSIEYNDWLQDVTMMFPSTDNSQFVVRYMDAARNISFFIAEGSARNRPQFIHYLKLAKSAIRECLVLTTLAHKQSNISDQQEEESRQQLMEMTKMIGALISSLQRSNNNSNSYDSKNGNGHYRGNDNGSLSTETRHEKYNNTDDHNYNDIKHKNRY